MDRNAPLSAEGETKELTRNDARKNNASRTILGHPIQLFYMFSIEFWERFSFYGLQAILAIYIYYSTTDGGLGLEPAVAIGLVGAYGGTVYFSSLLGAWLADRILGAERTLFYSALMVVTGHIVLAFFHGLPGLLIALALTALGGGGVKANAASIVGSLYKTNDSRRDAGFTIYFLSICLGTLVGPLLTGVVQTAWGFHFGFGLAAIGMCLGLLVYLPTRKRLPQSSSVAPNPLPSSRRWIPLVTLAAVIGVIGAAALTGIVNIGNLSQWVSGSAAAALICMFVLIMRSKSVTAGERKGMWVSLPVLICIAIFYALMMQVFGLLTTYADTNVDRSIGGWEAPVAWVSAGFGAFLVILGPPIIWFWGRMGDRQPPTAAKLGIALPIVGAAFLILIPFAGSTTGKTPLIVLAITLLLIAVAEMLANPAGLAIVTAVAPKSFQVQVVAVFYLAVAIGSGLSGLFGQLYDPENQVPYWLTMGLIAIFAGAFQLMFSRHISMVVASRTS